MNRALDDDNLGMNHAPVTPLWLVVLAAGVLVVLYLVELWRGR